MFSVLVVRRADDVGLRALRHPAAFEAAARAIPGLDVWTDPERAEPVTDVLAGGALLNIYRSQGDPNGDLVLPGLFFVGDSVATTTPVFGRGVTTTLWQCEALLSLLDHDADDLAATGHAFDAWSADTMRPWVEDHIHIDSARVDRWNGADVDLYAPLPSDLILIAAEVRPEIMASRGRLPLDGGAAGVAAGGRADRARGVRRRVAAVVRPRVDARRAGRDRGARRAAAPAGRASASCSAEENRSQDGAGVEDAVGVEGVLDPPGQRHHVGAELLGEAPPPWPCRRRARR